MLQTLSKTGLRIVLENKTDTNQQTTAITKTTVFDGLAYCEFDEGKDQIFTQDGITYQKRLLIYLPFGTLDPSRIADYEILINSNTVHANTSFNPAVAYQTYKPNRIERENGILLKHDYIICNV